MSNKWDSLGKPDRAKLLAGAGLPTGLAQLKWSGLQKSERTKLEKATKSKGKGWHEEKREVLTEKGIEKKAPIHRDVAIQKEANKALNVPMQKKESAHEERKEEKPTAPRKAKTYYDPKFEEAEAERIKDEGKREEESEEYIILPFDTGDLREMKQEAGIGEAYRQMGDKWFTEEKQKEWEKHEAEGYGGKLLKSHEYYAKTYPLAMEWINKHFKKTTSTKELEETIQIYFSRDWKQFEEFLQEKQDEILANIFEKEQKAQARKIESKYFTTTFRDIDDHNKKECVEKTPIQKAHPFSHKSIALFAHKDGKEWKVTEATTGFELARAHQFKGIWRNNSKEEIIQTAKAFIDEKTPEKVSELIKYAADTISRTSPCQS